MGCVLAYHLLIYKVSIRGSNAVKYADGITNVLLGFGSLRNFINQKGKKVGRKLETSGQRERNHGFQ